MSSGTYAGRVGFAVSGGPGVRPACPTAGDDPPAGCLAGLCVVCGRGTTRRDGAGLPRHAPWRTGPAACCPRCGAEMDGGPVTWWCAGCGRSAVAADLSRELAPAGPALAGNVGGPGGAS